MMNCETGFSRTSVSVGARRSVENPRGARHWGTSSCYRLHMRVGLSSLRLYRYSAAIWIGSRIASSANVPTRQALPEQACFVAHLSCGQTQLLFCLINQCLLMLALWSCGRRGSVVQAQRQIHGVLLAARPCCIRSVARAHCRLRL